MWDLLYHSAWRSLVPGLLSAALVLSFVPLRAQDEGDDGGGGGEDSGGGEDEGREADEDSGGWKWNPAGGPRSPLQTVLPFPPSLIPPRELLPKGDLVRAVAHLQSGDLSAARREVEAWLRRTPSAEAQVPGVFVRAHLEEAEGALERARRSWSSLRGKGGGLNVEIARGEGRVLALLGKSGEAAPRLLAAAEAAPEGPFRDDLLAQAAAAWFKAGEADQARAIYQDLYDRAGGRSRERYSMRLAEIDLTGGDAAAAAETLSRLSAEAESCSVGNEAGQILARAPRSTPAPSGAGTLRELARAERLRKCGAHGEAARVLGSLEGKVDAATSEEAWLKLWYHQWDLDKILNWCDGRLKAGVPDDVKRRLLRWQARAWWRKGDAARAADLRMASATTGGVAATTEQKFYAAGLYMEAHQFSRARALFQEVLAAGASSSQRRDIAWFEAWAALMTQDLVVARQGLTAIADQGSKNARWQSAMYWLVRLELAAGDAQAAASWLQKLEKAEPDGFYVFLARALRLPEAIEKARTSPAAPLAQTRAPPDRPVPGKYPSLPLPGGAQDRRLLPGGRVGDPTRMGLPPPWAVGDTAEYDAWSTRGDEALSTLEKTYGGSLPGLKVARDLSRAGYLTDAAEWVKESREVAKGSRDGRIYKMSREISALHYSYWYLRSPWYALLVTPSEGGLPPLGPDGGAGRWSWERRYPRAFGQEVSRACATWGVDPTLVYGIMRTESTYGPTRVSPVGARGLMQIMPATGARISAMLGEAFHTDDLFVPATNVRYGTWYLGRLLEKFAGQLPLAIASYNAGPRYVEGWTRRLKGVPIDVFIEEIPLRETREYVRKVLRAMSIYRILYAGGEGVPLPATVDGEVDGGVDF